MVNKSLNIIELSSLIWKNKVLLLAFSFMVAGFFAVYSISIPNKYSSNSVLYSKNEDVQNTNNFPLSGLSNFAGFGISVSDSDSLINLSIEATKSKDFFEFLIDKNDNLLPLLNAVKRFDKNSDTLIFDENVYKNKKFIKKDKNFFINSYKNYLSSFSIELDNTTNHVKLTTYHQSPYTAKFLLDLYKENINYYIRDLKLDDAKKAIVFYKKELASLKNPVLMENISMRILSELQTEFAAGTSNDFVFSYIDSPRVNHKKVGPPRAIITIFGFIIGFIFSLIYVLFKRAKEKYT
tara:strand:- start:946 stop:1827 length:882 start_codon:yes stop_codon:yes gene_type:complete